jgi:hypothetical protein
MRPLAATPGGAVEAGARWAIGAACCDGIAAPCCVELGICPVAGAGWADDVLGIPDE